MSKKHRLVNSFVSLVLGALLIFSVASVPSAKADTVASGTINSFELKKEFDGVELSTDLDRSGSNGVVATNDVVGFRWQVKATDVKGAVFSQTLPPGWEWDTQSFGTISTDNALYRAGYSLSPDGLTLTVDFDLVKETGNVTLIDLGVFRAKPTATVDSGSVYEPVATVSHPSLTADSAAEPVKVLSQPSFDLYKTTRSNNAEGMWDFGNGPEEARYIDFRIGFEDSETAIGGRETTLAQPALVRDSFTLDGPAELLGATFVPVVIGKSSPNGSVTISQDAGSLHDLDITFDNFPNLYGSWADVRFWVKKSEVPTTSQGLLGLQNSVTATDVVDSAGDQAVDVPGNNEAQGTVMRNPESGGGGNTDYWYHGKNILAFDDQGVLPPAVNIDPARSDQPFTDVTQQVVSPGTVVMSRLHMRAGFYNGTEVAPGATNVEFYDFWDPATQNIVPEVRPYVGKSNYSGGAADPSSYRFEYTNGSDRSTEQNSNTWYSTIAEVPGEVTGVRFTYLGTWGDLAEGEAAYLVVAIPHRVVAPVGHNVPDYALWKWTDVNNRNWTGETDQFVDVGNYQLKVAKTVDRRAVVSGSKLTYEIQPTIQRALGSTGNYDVNNLEITDKISPGVIDVDLSRIASPWVVVSNNRTPEGIELRLRYEGTVNTQDQLPAITYTATTSESAPSSRRIVNTAVISADKNSQPESVRSSQTNTTIIQAEVVSEEKTVLGDSKLDIGGKSVGWETRWFNFQTASQNTSYFVDVLPYNGDANGSRFSGKAELAKAILVDSSGNPTDASYGKLQYSTDNPETIRATHADPAAGITWIDQDLFDTANLSQVTAVRAVVNDLVSGTAGVGGLHIEMNVSGHKTGDVYINTSEGWLGLNGRLGTTNKAEVEVVSSSLRGILWNDQDGDGQLETNESRLKGSVVTLFDANDVPIMTTTSSPNGEYEFTGLPEGDYVVKVDPKTLGFPANYVVLNTYDDDSDHDSDSGILPVLKGTNFDRSVDFGYRATESAIQLDKAGKLASDARVGEWIQWSFEMTNSGENTLTDVTLTDHLAGVVDIAIAWPGSDGLLEKGEVARAIARYQLTQADLNRGYVENTATTAGRDPNGTVVEDPADARVYLPEGGALTLKKDGKLITDPVLGGKIRWNFTLSNTGNVTLSGLELHDALAGLGDVAWKDWPHEPFVLRPGESVVGSADSVLNNQDLMVGCVVNRADAQGTTPAGAVVASNIAESKVCFTPESSTPPPGKLPKTGGNFVPLIGFGSVLLGGGLLVGAVARRRSA